MGEALLSPPRHGFRPMKVVILDGYVDEPSNFGVPPYISPYPRYVAGAVRDAGHEWEYVTVDQVRAGHPLNGDLLVLLSGPIVPGKYLRSLPISERRSSTTRAGSKDRGSSAVRSLASDTTTNPSSSRSTGSRYGTSTRPCTTTWSRATGRTGTARSRSGTGGPCSVPM